MRAVGSCRQASTQAWCTSLTLLKVQFHRSALPCVPGSEQKGDPDEANLQEEMRVYGDIVRVDVVDTYGDLSLKTLKLFATLPSKIEADFYFKIDDDVAVNVDAMAQYLKSRRNQGNLYMVRQGCGTRGCLGFCQGRALWCRCKQQH